MDLFWELRRSSQVTTAQSAAARSEWAAKDAQDAVARLEARVNGLVLLNQALWSMVKDATGATDEELLRRVHELDAADGTADGRVRHAPEACPQCSRTLSQKHHKCLFCGFEPEDKDAFSRVAR